MTEIQYKEDQHDMKLKVVQKIVNEMIEEGRIIDSAQSVTKRIEDELGVKISFEFARSVMTKVMGMRWRKIEKASYHSNSQ